eukprot:gene11007-13020_t
MPTERALYSHAVEAACDSGVSVTVRCHTGGKGAKQQWRIEDSDSVVFENEAMMNFETYVSEICISAGSPTITLTGTGWKDGSIDVQSSSCALFHWSGSTKSTSFSTSCPSDASSVCPDGKAAVVVQSTPGLEAAENAWVLENLGGTKLDASGISAGEGYELEADVTYTAYTCVAEGASFQLELTSATGNGWPGGWVEVTTVHGQILASGPDGTGFTSQVLGPFKSVAADASSLLAGYPKLESTNSGCASSGGDGCQRIFDVLVSGQVDASDIYLYYSDVYDGYWLIASDWLSKDLYGYTYDEAMDPTAVSYGWDGANIAGITFTAVVANTRTPTMGSSSPTTDGPVAADGTPAPTGPTDSPTTDSPIARTPSDSPTTPSPTTTTHSPSAAVVYHCPEGYTKVKADLGGCDWMESYGCEDADENGGLCKHCGK